MQEPSYEYREFRLEEERGQRITLPEIAILGAAGFVLWKNRGRIKTLLEENGITPSSFLPSQVNEWLKTGADLLSEEPREEAGRREGRVPPPPPRRQREGHSH